MTKTCKDCKQVKPLTDFHQQKGGYYLSYCKACGSLRNQARQRRMGEEFGVRYDKAYHFMRAYGLSRDEAIALLAKACACCGVTGKTVVDHDHATNKVRGALCSNCNKVLVLVKENTQTLQNMVNYLIGFKDDNGCRDDATTILPDEGDEDD